MPKDASPPGGTRPRPAIDPGGARRETPRPPARGREGQKPFLPPHLFGGGIREVSGAGIFVVPVELLVTDQQRASP